MVEEYIVGLRINKIPNTYDKEYNEGDTIDEYEFITKNYETDVLTSRKIVLEESMCGSGYCSAEFLNENISTIKYMGSVHYTPRGQVEWKDRTEYGGNNFYTLYEGDDDYYPSAYLEIHFENWRETKRGKEVKPLYVFHGESAIGKSYVGNHSTLNVLDTDSLEACIYGLEAKEYVKYDIVVLGNKLGTSIDELKTYLAEVEVEIVSVYFSQG